MSPEPIRVVVIGSRRWPFRSSEQIRSFVRGVAAKYPEAIVVSGGAPGVDTWAELEALKSGLRVASLVVCQDPPASPGHWPIDEYSPGPKPYWIELREYEVGDDYGHPSRRRRLTEAGEYRSRGQALAVRTVWTVRQVGDDGQVIAFQYGQSRGTQIGIDEAKRLGLAPGGRLHVRTL